MILSISFFSASTIGISPGTIEISEKTNEIVCKNFTLMGEEGYIFNGEITWSNEKSKNIVTYTIPSDNLNIDSQIPSGINPGTYQLCLSSKIAGNYYGALKYKLNDSSYGIGTWIELNVSGKNFLSLTGKTIGGISPEKIFYFTPLLLFAILIFLFKKLKKKTEFR